MPPEERFIGGKGVERRCRFCGLGAPGASFLKIAHVIPHALENHWLFSRDECDACNAVGSALERELCNLMFVSRVLALPLTVSRRPELRLERRASSGSIVGRSQEPSLAIDLGPNSARFFGRSPTCPEPTAQAPDEACSAEWQENGDIVVTIKVPRHRPQMVARALARLALFVVDPASAPSVLDWVRERATLRPEIGRLSFAPVSLPFPSLMLYRLHALGRSWTHVLLRHGQWGLAMCLPTEDRRALPIAASEPFLSRIPHFSSLVVLDREREVVDDAIQRVRFRPAPGQSWEER